MARPYIIHVARQAVASNVKRGTNEPTIIVRKGKLSQRVHEVSLSGRVHLRSAFKEGIKPLACGARVWIEADEVHFQTPT
jgi:hypothetical protein